MRYGWTLEKQQWDHLLTVVSGTSWSNTKLDQLYRDIIPEGSGVYAICGTVPDATQCLLKALYNIFYVGQSKSLRRRFLEHCNRPQRGITEVKQCFGEDLDYWFTEVNLDRIDELEACLIDCFGPPANRIRGRIPARVGTPRPV